MSNRIPAEVFPPGEFLKDELEARGWTQVEFAEIIGRDTRLVSEVVSGKRAITPETAIAFGEALGTGPELWLNLESQYQLSKVRPNKDSIAKKANLHTKFPVREMVKRGWLQASKNVEVLEKELLDFFAISKIDETPALLQHAAKKHSYEDVSIHQLAWLYRARNIAMAAPAGKFSESKLEYATKELKEQLEYVEGTRNVAPILAKAGVKFVIVEALPGSKIDGACFWIKNSPIVALSLRFDRIDNFWHTLFHELDHIKHREGVTSPIVDIDMLTDGEKPEMELRANEAAAETMIPKAEMDGFIARLNPMFTDENILGFARRIHVHPGIVVGQLQNRKLIPWNFHRKYLEKFREFVTSSALTDGFGRVYTL